MPRASVYLLEIGAHDGTTLLTLRIASEGYVTGPNDNPADTEYPAAIMEPGYFSRALFSEGKTFGPSEVSYGDITIANAEGMFDAWIDYGFSGRPVVLKRLASRDMAYASAATLLRATLTRLEATNAYTEFRLRLYDRRLELDKPLQTNRYAGTVTGSSVNAEGTADMKDRPKPLCYGTCLNVPAVPVNPYDLIYQVSDGAVDYILAYDGGVALTDAGNYTTLAALRSATIPAGKFAKCMSLGLFRLGGSPYKLVTADVVEGLTLGLRNAGAVTSRILARMGLTGADNVDAASLTSLSAAAPGELGVFVKDDRTALSVLGDVLGSVGGWLLPNAQGVFTAGRFAAPGTPVWSLGEADIHTDEGGSIGIVANPDTDGGLPAWRIILRYQRNWQTQADGDLAGCVTVARRGFLANETREAKAENATVKVKHLLAPELTIDTLLVSAADAAAEASRRLALYSVRRDVIQFPVRRSDATLAVLGSTGTVTMQRLGYQAGRNMVVIGRREDPRSESVELTLWG